MELLYNNQKLNLDLPPSIRVDTFSPGQAEHPVTEDDFVTACQQSDIIEFLKDDSILFIINDAHRNTPTAQILSWFDNCLPDLIPNISFLVACGTHEPPTIEEYRKIFGNMYEAVKDRVSYHNCHDYEAMAKIGLDKFGEDVWINKKVLKYNKLFTINSVEPHYFAGYTGGRKSFFPGLADFKTIERNHNLANSLDCAPMKIAGNPMAEHLNNLISLIETSKIQTLQIVYDAKKVISSIHFGDIHQAFDEAVIAAEKIYVSKVPHMYDTVLLEIDPPLDRNLYQAQKALENSQAVVKDNGAAIIIAACQDGIGSDHFYQLAENWDGETNQPKDGQLRFGSHKLSRVNAIGKRINNYIYSQLTDEIVKKVFYKSLDDIQHFLLEDSNNNDNYRLALVHDAAHTVLISNFNT